MTTARLASRSDEDLTTRDVVEAVTTLHRAFRQYGYVGLGIFALASTTGILTIPPRLKQVEEDHVAIRRHQNRIEQGQAWLICTVSERTKGERGDPATCDRLRPAPEPEADVDADGRYR